MKIIPLIGCLAMLTVAARLHAEPTPAVPAKEAGTNNPAAPLVIPLAVFDATNGTVKDPFFPLTTRTPVPVSNTNTVPAFQANMFTLKGLSGSASQRLALINNCTLAAGEEGEVNTSNGRVKIRCLSVKETSAVIRVENQDTPIELSFDDRPRLNTK